MSSTTTRGDDPHRRAKRSLVRLYSGLLEEADNEWLTGHLATCEACKAMAAAMETDRDALLEDGRHLPSSLIARWGAEYPRLEGIQREFVESHLRGCEQCRRTLEIVGHADAASAFSPVTPPRPQPGLMGWLLATARRRWISGGALVAATSGILLLIRILGSHPEELVAVNHPKEPVVVTPRVQPESTFADTLQRHGRAHKPVPPTIPPTSLPVPAPVASLEVWKNEDVPVGEATQEIPLARDATRGSGESDTTKVFVVKQGTRTLKLAHPEAVLWIEAKGAMLDITVVTPSGKALHHRMPASGLRRDRPLRLQLPDGIEPGTYRYSYVFTPRAQTGPIEGEISIKIQ